MHATLCPLLSTTLGSSFIGNGPLLCLVARPWGAQPSPLLVNPPRKVVTISVASCLIVCNEDLRNSVRRTHRRGDRRMLTRTEMTTVDAPH